MTKFSDLLEKKFLITVELNPPKGTNVEKAFREVKSLQGKIDAVNITDSPLAKVRMSPIALCTLVRQKFDINTIFNLTCRDRNLIGLQSDLLGAAALGVDNILCITGDPPKIGDHPKVKGVYAVNSVELVKLAQKLNSGFDYTDHPLDKPTSFCIGVAVNPVAQNFSQEIKKFRKKVEAGAQFALTQPVYDLKVLEKFQKETRDIKIPVIIGVLPLKSYKFARYLNDKVPGIVIPNADLKKMEEAGEGKEKEVGLEIILNFLKKAKPKVAGIHIMPISEPEVTVRIVQAVRNV